MEKPIMWETGSPGHAESSIHPLVASIIYKMEGFNQISKVTFLTIITQRQHTQKWKVHTNITNEQRYKNAQQNTSILKPTIH